MCLCLTHSIYVTTAKTGFYPLSFRTPTSWVKATHNVQVQPLCYWSEPRISSLRWNCWGNDWYCLLKIFRSSVRRFVQNIRLQWADWRCQAGVRQRWETAHKSDFAAFFTCFGWILSAVFCHRWREGWHFHKCLRGHQHHHRGPQALF